MLAINPGSTSTKIALYEDENKVFTETLKYPVEKLEKFDNTLDQFEMRKDAVLSFLMEKKLRGNGGLKAYLGTTDARKIEKMIEDGDEKARIVYEAMAYQIAKGIGELATVVDGKVDAIILTGGIAYSGMITSWIKKRVGFIAPVEIMEGKNEMESLAYGILRVLRGEEEAREYTEND